MLDTLLSTALLYGVFLYAPGLVVLLHPRAGAKFPAFWAAVIGVSWVVFASLQLLGLGVAAIVWTFGTAVLTTGLAASALLAHQNLKELEGRQRRRQVRI